MWAHSFFPDRRCHALAYWVIGQRCVSWVKLLLGPPRRWRCAQRHRVRTEARRGRRGGRGAARVSGIDGCIGLDEVLTPLLAEAGSAESADNSRKIKEL